MLFIIIIVYIHIDHKLLPLPTTHNLFTILLYYLQPLTLRLLINHRRVIKTQPPLLLRLVKRHILLLVNLFLWAHLLQMRYHRLEITLEMFSEVFLRNVSRVHWWELKKELVDSGYTDWRLGGVLGRRLLQLVEFGEDRCTNLFHLLCALPVAD